MKKKKVILTCVIVMVIMMLSIGIKVSFYEPSKINAVIASKVFKTPANSSFVDGEFYKCVIDSYNSEKRTEYPYTYELTNDQLSSLNKLHCSWAKNYDIRDTIGLEKMTGLTYINLDGTIEELNEIDLSKNTNLIYLHLTGGKSFVVNQGSTIGPFSTKITELNIANNIKLKELYISRAELTYLDISNNTMLEVLDIGCNELQQLDISKNTALTYLDIGSNNLSSIDVSNNKNIKYLNLYRNPLTEIIGLDKLTELLKLDVYGANLNALNIVNSQKLTYLEASNNQLTTLDVSNNTALTRLSVPTNQLTKLDVSKNTLLTSLNVSNNKLTSLDVSKNTELIKLSAQKNKLTLLDVSGNTSLTDLDVFDNQLTTLDISSNTSLTELTVYDNELVSLDVSKNTLLTYLIIHGNGFKKNIFVYKNTNINLFDNDVKLPPEKILTINSISNYSNNLNTNVISFEDAGEYEFRVDYTHNISSSNNTFSVGYNVKVIELTSEKYKINDEQNYIYTGIDIDSETILNNVSVNYGDALIENNKLLIKYNDEIIKTFDIVNISNDKYIMGNSYIYVGISSLNLEKINVINGTKEIKDNKLLIKNNDEVLESFDIASISSSIYDLSKDYIYVGSGSLNLENIKVINVAKEIKDNKLLIRKDNNILDEFEIKNISFNNMKVSSKLITVSKDKSYEDFTSNIILDEAFAYEIINGDTEVTSGAITKGMVLKIYDGEDIIDTYNITDEYLDMSKLNIKEDKKHINGFGFGKKISELKQNISTSGKVTITNPKGVVLTDTGILTTGTKVKIELATETKEYTVVIKGDVTGTGEASVSDVAKLYQHLKKKITMEDCYIEAGNVYSDDNEIKINDVAKLYQFIKGKIKTLD